MNPPKPGLTFLFFILIITLASSIEVVRAEDQHDEPGLSIALKSSAVSSIEMAGAPQMPAADAPSGGTTKSLTPIIGTSGRNDLSLPLNWMPVIQNPATNIVVEVPNKKLPRKVPPQSETFRDPAVQNSPFSADISVTPNIPATGANFDGIPNVNGVLPPDTNGDVGPNHFVQTVNSSFAVFSKTGTTLLSPRNINTLWAGFGGACQTTNNGDPIVQYDQLADRWMITQFALPNIATNNGPFFQCIAVSQTPDPTGAYFRYEFKMSDTLLNDYPHFGVWPDAYFMSINQFTMPAGTFNSAGAVAFERNKMLLGQAAKFIKFDVASEAGQLPCDLDGFTLPPSGSGGLFVDFEFNALHFWRFVVDFVTPANSSFNPISLVSVAAFDTSFACGASGRDCIPQPGTAEGLDVISDRMMYRAAYRNMGSFDLCVVSHTVDAGTNHAGVRWYEVRRSNGTPSTVNQQATFAPDADHRWMGSVAMDHVGNIAIGYSVSGTSLFPSIRYTGRLVTDPLNTTPQGEGTIIAGGGSQTNAASRWGDYSSLSVDPSDDCTFWYTNEYLQTTSSASWRTRIASFKFPNCGVTGCSAPSSLTNNTAVDQDPCADTGVLITWAKDAGNWGDNNTGTRSYDVLRNGTAIATGVPYGTTSFVDTTAANTTVFTYSIRYKNGCGLTATTAGANAGDAVPGTITQTANQNPSSFVVKNQSLGAFVLPAFTITGATAATATVTWTLTGTTNLTTCTRVRLRAPDAVTFLTLKASGAANTGSANVLTFYQSKGPGTYAIFLTELSNCGSSTATATLTNTKMTVTKNSCP